MTESLLRRPRRTYTEEFKAARVAEARQAEASVAEIARRHGLNHNLIFKWRREADESLSPKMLAVRVVADAPSSSESLPPKAAEVIVPVRVTFADGASLAIGQAPEALVLSLLDRLLTR